MNSMQAEKVATRAPGVRLRSGAGATGVDLRGDQQARPVADPAPGATLRSGPERLQARREHGQSNQPAPGAAPRSGPEERIRRRFVLLVYLLFVLLVSEGFLRKVLFTDHAALAFFLRDPFLALAYVHALRLGSFRKPEPLLTAGMLFGLLSIPLWMLQYAQFPVDKGPMLAAFGWRMYFGYMPLMFAIAREFNERDIRRFAYLVALAMIINAPVMALQFSLPHTHWLHVGTATDEAGQFKQLGVSGLKVRSSGTFTTVVGPTHLITIAAAFAFSSWAGSRRERIYPPAVLYLVFGALATGLAVAGSRGAILMTGGVLVVGIASALLLRGGVQRTKMLTLPPIAGVASFAAFPILFPEAFETFSARWVGANEAEGGSAGFGWIPRFLAGFTHPLNVIGEVPLTGFGLGLASNAASILGVTIDGRPLPYTEVDWARQFVEFGPVVGALYIVFRVVFAASLFIRGVRATRVSSTALPMVLSAYVAYVIAQDQISGNGTTNGFAWLIGGVALASIAVIERRGKPMVAVRE